jgi:hypothetical protein
MKKAIAFGLALVTLVTFAHSLWAEDSVEKLANAAAETWLALVDQGEYAESWRQAAAYFRNAVPEKQWVESMVGFRKPLGHVISRRLISRIYTKTLPGAPDGQYVVLQYETSFESKESAVETVTPMLDKDKTWRVSGYYIR